MEKSPQDVRNPKTLPEDAHELLYDAQGLLEGAENYRTLGHLKNLEDDKLGSSNKEFEKAEELDRQSEKLSMKGFQITKEDLHKDKINAAQDKEIARINKKRESARLQELKDVRTYLKSEKAKKGIDSPLQFSDEEEILENKYETIVMPEISTFPKEDLEKPETKLEVPEQQEIREIGLSSPEELERSLAEITDEDVVQQNLDTRLELIDDLKMLKVEAENKYKNASEVYRNTKIKKFDELIHEQETTIGIINARKDALRKSRERKEEREKKDEEAPKEMTLSWGRRMFDRLFGGSDKKDKNKAA